MGSFIDMKKEAVSFSNGMETETDLLIRLKI